MTPQWMRRLAQRLLWPRQPAQWGDAWNDDKARSYADTGAPMPAPRVYAASERLASVYHVRIAPTRDR